jgi:class 3 adenylate cyclase
VVEELDLSAPETAPASPELRYVTVLFADLSGFTEFSA